MSSFSLIYCTVTSEQMHIKHSAGQLTHRAYSIMMIMTMPLSLSSLLPCHHMVTIIIIRAESCHYTNLRVPLKAQATKEKVRLHQMEKLLYSKRQSTKWKDNLLNGRKYLQTVYLIRDQYPTYIRNSNKKKAKKKYRLKNPGIGNE